VDECHPPTEWQSFEQRARDAGSGRISIGSDSQHATPRHKWPQLLAGTAADIEDSLEMHVGH
jgi:hypothetical protein